MLPVILSGGSGTRLWPISRKNFPKQFHPVISNKSLFQETVERLHFVSKQNPLVVCNEEHRFIVAEQLREKGVTPKGILLEPVGRNTAPAIAVASFSVLDADPLLIVSPADHYIPNVEEFSKAIEKGVHCAENGKLVTFGITPTYPETGYGYIHTQKKLNDSEPLEIINFIEKPILEKAKKFVASDAYYWNSGIFLFKASTYLNQLKTLNPSMYSAAKNAYEKGVPDLDFYRLDKSFHSCPSDSIDYTIMEKTQDSVVVPLTKGWSDVGTWASVWQTKEKDLDGNVKQGDVVTHSTKNCYLRSEKLLVTIGIEDTIIVETDDAILVAKKEAHQSVKEVVEKLEKEARSEVKNHRKVYRPWGFYDSLNIGERHQVKRIVVKPGSVLSLQYHHHRSEHWVVVKGTAKVTRGSEVFFVSENESTYIPLGEVHRLENPGKFPLELIEVQLGSYLGEDDIVRLEDIYSRN